MVTIVGTYFGILSVYDYKYLITVREQGDQVCELQFKLKYSWKLPSKITSVLHFSYTKPKEQDDSNVKSKDQASEGKVKRGFGNKIKKLEPKAEKYISILVVAIVTGSICVIQPQSEYCLDREAVNMT